MGDAWLGWVNRAVGVTVMSLVGRGEKERQDTDWKEAMYLLNCIAMETAEVNLYIGGSA